MPAGSEKTESTQASSQSWLFKPTVSVTGGTNCSTGKQLFLLGAITTHAGDQSLSEDKNDVDRKPGLEGEKVADWNKQARC